MWNYEKRLQFPVNIKKPDARAAQVIISQYGGPDPRNLEVGCYLLKCSVYNKMIQYYSPVGNRGIFLFNKCFECVVSCDTVYRQSMVFLELPHRCLQSAAECSRIFQAIWIVSVKH